MQRARGSFALPVLFMMVLLAWSISTLQAAQPVVQSAQYVDVDNTLEIVFDQPVYNDSIHVVRGGITLDGDNGGENADFTLSGGLLSGSPTLSETIRIRLTYSDQQIIETMADKESLKLLLEHNAFVNQSMEGNAASISDQAISVAYIVDPTAPIVQSATYDAGKNTLTVVFDRPVNGRQIELTKIFLDDDSSGPKDNLKFSSINERVETASVSNTMILSFNPKHQQQIENMDVENLSLVLLPFALVTDKSNSVKATGADYLISIAYVADNKPTVLRSASYDATENNLRLFFNEKVLTTYRSETAVNYKGIGIIDPLLSESAKLSGAAAVSVTADTQLVIMVLPADQRLIEDLTNKTRLLLTLEAFSILDESGNGIRSYSTSDSIRVAYKEEADKDAPAITQAAYNAATNILTLSFGNITGTTRGIDTTNVNLTGVFLTDGGADSIVLSGGEVTGIKSGVPAFIRSVEIVVNTEDEAKIENLANKNQITLGVDALSFFFESYTKTRNGNHELTAGQITVTYQADAVVPQLLSARYDFKESLLTMAFDKLVNVSLFDPKTVSFGGVTLTGGAIQETSASSTLTIGISSQDQAAIDALSVATKAAPTVALSTGAVKNLDGIGNAEASYKDGDASPTGSAILVGYGRSFWDKGYELFPKVDRLVEASLRAVGDHSYFYVADSSWRVHVTPENVQSILTAFETSTPADPNKGIYQICRETFGQEPNTDNDSRIYILLMNLRDEFGIASGDASADIPKAGAFEERNEKKVAADPHSNEVDMIYIDAEPIVRAGYAPKVIANYFTYMIMHRVDPNEDAWVSEGMAAMAQDICGYGYSSFRFPAELPSIPTNSPLTLWTGWTGGHPGTDINERNKVYLFFRYIFEQYGGKSTISAIAAEQENGIASVDKILATKDANLNTWSIFRDLATACIADVQDDPTYGNKYGIASTGLRSPTILEITFKANEFTNSVTQWSLAYHLVKGGNNPGSVNFNGDDNATFVVRVVSLSPLTIREVTLDSKNEARIDLSMDGRSVYLVVARKEIGTAGGAYYTISKDLQSPNYVDFRVFQNPSINRLIDFHILSSERLYADAPPTEGPVVTAKVGKSETKYVGELAFSDTRTGVYNYKASVAIQTSGAYTFTLSGQDAGGSDFTPIEVSAQVQKMAAEQGAQISDATTGAVLAVPAHAMSSDIYLTAIPSSDGKSVTFGPSSESLVKKARIVLPYDSDQNEGRVGICRLENETWVYVGGRIDRKAKTISAEIDRLGEFSLQSGDFPFSEGSSELPDRYSLRQNYPNPFNPTSTIEYELPQAGQVTIKVIDILGKEVASIENGYREAGSYKVTVDAKDLGTGVYFYTIHSGSFAMTRKMMVLK